jgi:hypothetical protein
VHHINNSSDPVTLSRPPSPPLPCGRRLAAPGGYRPPPSRHCRQNRREAKPMWRGGASTFWWAMAAAVARPWPPPEVRAGRGHRLASWWHRWQVWWEALIRSFTLELGWLIEGWRWPLKLVHKTLSLDITKESTKAIAEAQGLDYFSGVVLAWWCFATCVWRAFNLYDHCKAFCQSVLNKWNKARLYTSLRCRGCPILKEKKCIIMSIIGKTFP